MKLHRIASKGLIVLTLTATPLLADSTTPDLASEVAALRTLVEDQQRQITELHRDKGETWLTERRAEEVKLLVREVLSDAQMRASMLDAPITAGYDNGFFITTEDGKYLLKTNLETQIRYIYSNVDNDAVLATGGGAGTPDDDENGFQVRRARIAFSGNFIDPKFTYRFRIAYDRASGNLSFDDAWVAYQLTSKFKLQVGQYKPQFLREETVSSTSQLAVEQSYLADYFGINFTQAAELTYNASDFLHAVITIHDGSYAANTDFDSDRSNFAVSGRVEALLAGNWRQFRDFTSWSAERFGLMVGAAADYEIGEEGAATNTPDIFKYAFDVSAEFGGANFFAAFYGQHFDGNDSPVGVAAGLPSNLDGANQIAFVVQGGVFVIPDKLELFARYEWIDFDDVYYRNSGAGVQTVPAPTGAPAGNIAGDELSIVTIGGNYYFYRHNAKFTLDVLWALDPVPVANTGGGLLANPGSSADDEVAIRAQMQFTF